MPASIEAICSFEPICSAPAAITPTNLISPPRDWPDSFKSPPLKAFVTKILKGKRARLVAAAPPNVDPQLSWVKIVGYAVKESAADPGIYVALPQTWLEHPTGTWVNRAASDGEQVLLIESAVPPEAAAAAAKAATAAAAPSNVLDITDAHPPAPSPAAPPATPATTKPPPATTKPPPATAKPSPAAPEAPLLLPGMWRSREEIRYIKDRKVRFPQPRSQVRLMLHEDKDYAEKGVKKLGGTFEFEARRWGQKSDGLRDGDGEFAHRVEPPIMAPLEYGDREASSLHVTGTWKEHSFSPKHREVRTLAEASH